MNKSFLPLTAAACFALAVTGCESTGGIAARTQEKSAVYATLKTWEKKYIERGSIAVGFTPDMVYMALGHPGKVATKDFPEGPAELWTYSRAYPNSDAMRGFKHVSLTLDSAFQSAQAGEPPPVSKVPASSTTLGDKAPPPAPERGGTPSIAQAGSPQGGSMEPADLGSSTIQILFENGQVARMSVVPNTN